MTAYRPPSTASDHAVDRLIERWWPGSTRFQADYYLRHVAKKARFVEAEDGNAQAIWAVPGFHDGEMLIVVDAMGVIMTVLPPGAKKPSGRR